MRNRITVILWLVLVLAVNVFAQSGQPADTVKTDVVTITVSGQHSEVRPGSSSALAIHFELSEDWHFYADGADIGGLNLKVKPTAGKDISFSDPIFPQPHLYFDKSAGKKVYVFSDKFKVFLPFSAGAKEVIDESILADVEIAVEGAVCSGFQCMNPKFGVLKTGVKIVPNTAMAEPAFTLPAVTASRPLGGTDGAGLGVWFALGLALLAGLSLNVMPCVWPILPLIVMRIVAQAKEDKSKSVAMGGAFCIGILLFFACLAGANIILQIFYGTVLQWGDQFRSPGFVAGMSVLLVVLALFMFGLFTVSVPSSVASKSGSGKGYSGAVGMGFLAAVLSTPCSFAILAVAFAWAQTQPLVLATLAMMVIGVGMAAPYAILTSMPGLLKRLPRAGRWMELVKQTMGFILLVIALKLIAALPQARQMGVLYFALALAFGVWMWGGWVDHNTKAVRKWSIRFIAIALMIAAGLVFLPAPADELIDWQGYDATLIETAKAESRPVLIKFTAKWCANCMVADKLVYKRKDIAKLIEEKNVLAIKADTTVRDYPATAALKNVYNELSIPVSILFMPGQAESIRWHELSFGDELKTHLEKLPEP